MITISLCMIVKNEEETIERCLKSVEGAVDEIIVVDTGSGDRTKEIASGLGAKVYDFKWIDDFSAARNFSYEQAAMDYILWLDADDILLPDDAAKLKALKQSLPADISAVMMKYNTAFDAHGNVTFSYFRERLSRRSSNFKWREPVHEYLEVSGKRLNSDIRVTHSKPAERPSGRNISIFERLIGSGKELSPRGEYYFARELKDNGRYSEAIVRFSKFLDSGHGWVEDNITACGELANCYLEAQLPDKALPALLRSFTYDTPRAEICCQIGYYFKQRERYPQAIFWFKLILGLEKNADNWGFSQEDSWGYIPCIELAVCYDKIAQYKTASAFNDMALEYKPDSVPALQNRKYFAEKLVRCAI